MARPTEEVLDLAFFALDHAIKSVANSNGPLIPFAIIECVNGERAIARFTTGRNPEEARQHARAHVAQTAECARYAVAADGSINDAGRRIAVVMVEVGQRGDAHGFSFIQRFVSTSECRFAEPIGNPGIIGEPTILHSSVAG